MKYEEVEVNSERWFELTPLLNEEFRNIKGYEGQYQVSNYGRVKSLERKVFKNNNFNIKYTTYKEKILLQVQKNIKNNQKYYTVAMYKKDKRCDKKVHILVAEVFLNKQDFKSMPDEDRNTINLNKLQVNHKDEHQNNNKLPNLEWCTHKYNCNYGTRIERIRQTKLKKGDDEQ